MGKNDKKTSSFIVIISLINCIICVFNIYITIKCVAFNDCTILGKMIVKVSDDSFAPDVKKNEICVFNSEFKRVKENDIVIYEQSGLEYISKVINITQEGKTVHYIIEDDNYALLITDVVAVLERPLSILTLFLEFLNSVAGYIVFIGTPLIIFIYLLIVEAKNKAKLLAQNTVSQFKLGDSEKNTEKVANNLSKTIDDYKKWILEKNIDDAPNTINKNDENADNNGA